MEHLEAAGLATFPKSRSSFSLYLCFLLRILYTTTIRNSSSLLLSSFSCFSSWNDGQPHTLRRSGGVVSRYSILGRTKTISEEYSLLFLASVLKCCPTRNAGTRHQRRKEKRDKLLHFSSIVSVPTYRVAALWCCSSAAISRTFFISCSSVFLAICKVSNQRTQDFEIPSGQKKKRRAQRRVSRMFPSSKLNDIVHQFTPAKLGTVIFHFFLEFRFKTNSIDSFKLKNRTGYKGTFLNKIIKFLLY